MNIDIDFNLLETKKKEPINTQFVFTCTRDMKQSLEEIRSHRVIDLNKSFRMFANSLIEKYQNSVEIIEAND